MVRPARTGWVALIGLAIVGSTACSAEETGPPPTAIVGLITCAADGASAVSPVQVQADGVHFVVNVPEDVTAIVGDGRGDEPDEWLSGPGEAVSTLLGTGTYEVGCRDGATDAVLPVRATLEIVDPGGIWRDDRLTCRDQTRGISDYVAGTEGEHGDLVGALRRHVTGLRPTDVVGPAGYPADGDREIRIVREGVVVAVATYEETMPDNWLLAQFAVCGSSGIGG